MTGDADALVLRELTAPHPGAVSVLELRGPGALERVAGLARRAHLEPGGLQLVRLEEAGELIDEALVWAPDERCVELHLHGSRPLVERVVRALGLALVSSSGDSLEERAWARSATAFTEAAARVLVDQAEGALRRELEELARAEAAAFAPRLERLVRRSRALERLFRPSRVVLAGPANAGKSTLFNALVGFERVVVDATRGTTRDVVQERIAVGAYPVDIMDTAGLDSAPANSGAPTNVIERAGQASGRALWVAADLVLWLEPADRAQDPPASAALESSGVPPERCLRIFTRADEVAGDRGVTGLGISALRDPRSASATVVEAISGVLGFEARPWTPGAPVLFDPSEWDWALRAESARDPSTAVACRAELESLLAR